MICRPRIAGRSIRRRSAGLVNGGSRGIRHVAVIRSLVVSNGAAGAIPGSRFAPVPKANGRSNRPNEPLDSGDLCAAARHDALRSIGFVRGRDPTWRSGRAYGAPGAGNGLTGPSSGGRLRVTRKDDAFV
jgi:hypothetical protein